VPWLLETGRGPHGLRRYYAPLAVIQWTPAATARVGQVIHDCRDKFPRSPASALRHVYRGAMHAELRRLRQYPECDRALPAEGGEVCLLPASTRQNFHIVNRQGISVTVARATILMDDGTARAR